MKQFYFIKPEEKTTKFYVYIPEQAGKIHNWNWVRFLLTNFMHTFWNKNFISSNWMVLLVILSLYLLKYEIKQNLFSKFRLMHPKTIRHNDHFLTASISHYYSFPEFGVSTWKLAMVICDDRKRSPTIADVKRTAQTSANPLKHKDFQFSGNTNFVNCCRVSVINRDAVNVKVFFGVICILFWWINLEREYSETFKSKGRGL